MPATAAPAWKGATSPMGAMVWFSPSQTTSVCSSRAWHSMGQVPLAGVHSGPKTAPTVDMTAMSQ